MKKWFVFFVAILFLTACGGNEQASSKKINVTVKEYEGRITQALKEMGDKTNLKLISNEVNDDGVNVITLSEDIIIFVESKDDRVTKASLGMTSTAYLSTKEDFDFALRLLVGTVDDSLSFADRDKVLKDLGLFNETVFAEDHTKVVTNKDVMYTYKGSLKENFILQAEYK